MIEAGELNSFDEVAHLAGNPSYSSLLYSPEICSRLFALSRAFDDCEAKGGMTRKDRAWLTLVNSVDFDLTRYLIDEQIEASLKLGVRGEAMIALWEGRDDVLTADERLLASYVRQVHASRVTDETYSAMHDRVGQRALSEITLYCLYHPMMLRQIEAFAARTFQQKMSLDDIRRVIAKTARNAAAED